MAHPAPLRALECTHRHRAGRAAAFERRRAPPPSCHLAGVQEPLYVVKLTEAPRNRRWRRRQAEAVREVAVDRRRRHGRRHRASDRRADGAAGALRTSAPTRSPPAWARGRPLPPAGGAAPLHQRRGEATDGADCGRRSSTKARRLRPDDEAVVENVEVKQALVRRGGRRAAEGRRARQQHLVAVDRSDRRQDAATRARRSACNFSPPCTACRSSRFSARGWWRRPPRTPIEPSPPSRASGKTPCGRQQARFLVNRCSASTMAEALWPARGARIEEIDRT